MPDYGTLMIANLKPGRRDALLGAEQRWVAERQVHGFVGQAALVTDDAATVAVAVRFDSKDAYAELAADPMHAWYREHQAPHLDGEVRSINGTWHDISSPGVLLAEKLGRCFAEQRFDHLAELYASDAEFELHVGAEHDRRTGRDQIRDRYAQDFAVRPEFLRWEPVATARGAIIEADAHQDSPVGRLRFRWIHVLDVNGGWIRRDTVYCTGGTTA
ncbi:MAG TPA: nuclear transport factor 2 family protein [Candidatus Limnocylindrales bacterium]|jgi:hypothetical protein|nr:nuclear transport factor 2 family protein [Acidimicrobiales bacterium]HVM25881.1 nuclear transport factor 2 family protein [Candidatus Limnocylindrales bacterium]